MIFDTHAHYDDGRFDEDRHELLTQIHADGVSHIVNIGATVRSCYDIMDLIEQYDFMYGALGIHPEDVENMTDEVMMQIRQWSEHPKILAIGEIGLDYYYDEPARDLQKEWFLKQALLAKELSLPIVVHSRDAASDTIDLLQEAGAADIGGVIHCYSYSKELAKTFLDMDFFIGVGGVLTFKNGRKLKETVEYVPLDKIVIETDCPYLAPVPYRGKRNHSGYLTYVLDEIANIKGISREEAEAVTYANARRLYRMDANE